jgi:hypothetical protein
MFQKKFLIIVLLNVHLAISLKSRDFCIRNQVCGKKKCKLIKCPDKTFSNDCGSDICSKNITECKKYNDRKLYLNIEFDSRIFHALSTKQQIENEKFEFFKKHILDCKFVDSKFKPNDYCLMNDKICRIVHHFRYQKIIEEKDCECPKKQSYKCGKYCTTNSLACEYFESNKIKKRLNNITNCSNDEIIFFKANFIMW